MNTFADPHTTTYLTRSIFTMPKDTGGQLAIAVTTKEYSYLNSAYTIFITGIVAFSWEIVVFFVLMYYPTERWPRKRSQKDKDGVFTEHAEVPRDEAPSNPNVYVPPPQYTEKDLLKIRKRKANRYIALISIWNSADPWSAIWLLLEHTFSMFFDAKDTMTGTFNLFVILAAFTVGVGTIGAGTIIPSFLQIGNVAPPKPGSIFYAIASEDPVLAVAQGIEIQQMRAPATQRAMGTVESARSELKKRVAISSKTKMPWKGPGNETIEQITYEYNITGLDFGLQLAHADEFVVDVKGACTLEYGWFDRTNSDDLNDVYNVFGNQIYVLTGEIARPPGGSISLDTSDQTGFTGANRSYAIIPDTVARGSNTEGFDPWYLTYLLTCDGCTGYAVERARPVLSCWQQDVWSYQGHKASSILKLGDLPGLDLPDPIKNEIIPSRLTSPMIEDVASQLGNSILVSSTGSLSGNFNANISSYAADFERLILASYVASQNIFLDTTLINPKNTYGLKNNALGDSGNSKPGVNKFVIRGNSIVTLSPQVLIFVPLLWAFLWVLRGAFAWSRSAHRNSGKLSRLTLRAVSLQPVQLYRLLDEEMCGFRDDWTNRRGHLPYIVEPRPLYSEMFSPNQDRKLPIVEEREMSEEEISREERIGPVLSAPPRQYPLFIAPKVLKEVDDRYHLRFTGPMPHDPHKKIYLPKGEMEGWSWRQDHGKRRSVVADNPNDTEPPKQGSSAFRWFKKIVGLATGEDD